MNYQIETITKDNAWVSNKYGLIFEIYFEASLMIEAYDDAAWGLDGPVYYLNTDDLVCSELADLIEDSITCLEVDYSEVHEHFVCQAEFQYDSLMDR